MRRNTTHMSKPVTCSIRFKHDLYEALQSQAKAENRKFSNMVETILREYMERKKK